MSDDRGPRSIPVQLFDDDRDLENAKRILDTFLGPPRKKRPPSVSVGPWDKAKLRANERMLSGDWLQARPMDFVALYEILHESTYGVLPAELTASIRPRAAAMARRLLETQFGGDRTEFAEWMRWVWIREEGREKCRNKECAARIGWALQFNGALVTDWRLQRRRHA